MRHAIYGLKIVDKGDRFIEYLCRFWTMDAFRRSGAKRTTWFSSLPAVREAILAFRSDVDGSNCRSIQTWMKGKSDAVQPN